MRNLERRIQRIEGLVNEEDGLTEEDVELILSCMPKEMADAIMKELLEYTEQKVKGVDDRQLAKLCGKPNSRSGLHGRTLELIMNGLLPECATALKAKLATRGI